MRLQLNILAYRWYLKICFVGDLTPKIGKKGNACTIIIGTWLDQNSFSYFLRVYYVFELYNSMRFYSRDVSHKKCSQSHTIYTLILWMRKYHSSGFPFNVL
jgi:hypothetical protein